MQFNAKVVYLNDNKEAGIKCIDDSNIVVPVKSILSIDGSTTNTGIAILRETDGALMYLMSATREDNETPVQYKVRLKRKVESILIKNSLIQKVYYEEPFLGYATAAPNLFMLRTFIEELIVENEPSLDYIKKAEINNMAWKKCFLDPIKCPSGTELQKKAVKDKLVQYLPFMSGVSQDEIDATSMGFAVCTQLSKGLNESLQSKKKASAFSYNIQFIGADEDDTMIQEFYDIYSGPKKLLENGIVFSEIKSSTNFDKHVYELMGSDDKVVIIKFSSKHHSNIVLKHKIGSLAVEYDYIYAVVWRKSRKY